MGTCEAYNISHSHFLGGPPEWTQADRDKAIWYQLRKAETCSSCGTHPDDWDPAAGGHRHAYTAVPTRCAGCAVLEQARLAHDADPHKGRGETVVLKRMPNVEAITVG